MKLLKDNQKHKNTKTQKHKNTKTQKHKNKGSHLDIASRKEEKCGRLE